MTTLNLRRRVYKRKAYAADTTTTGPEGTAGLLSLLVESEPACKVNASSIPSWLWLPSPLFNYLRHFETTEDPVTLKHLVVVASPTIWQYQEFEELQQQTHQGLDREKFSQELIHVFEEEPIEDGYFHPAERIIERALRIHGETAIEWIKAIYQENQTKRPPVSAGVLRCVGRLQPNQVLAWGISLAVQGLSSQDIEIREAAIRALEMWGGEESLRVLQSQAINERVPWLAEYINRVIADLSK